ncbi:hypothetical protein A33Q_3374 [Indibacter alkaliphilus LW1]|uniref:Deoxyribose-phosphate aldolase n=1 Tax=Indibacter alkaliphilus (strain CCUG 57479 / KCTC 22604 / LW1) TaxID=1189612 RepID=S2D8D1_INDAL|nr:DUF6503 family protein [Indibacter alkaliphilus]EOZ95169.1 hypothetical protein A33Q_3374 [Indibacter alkaliphilus LW1]
MRFFLYLFLAMTVISSCSQKSEAEKIIDKAILAHGGMQFEKVRVSFDFRDRYYEIFKSSEAFEYLRQFTDSTGLVRDVLNNSGFVRTVNGTQVELEEKWVKAYSNSVNSVAYFAFLPYGLNDPAVFKTYLGESEIEDQKYHLVKVTFSEDGGGEDFEDEFLYWINQDTYLTDYLAYSYLTEGGGVRFRKVSNRHEIEGLVLQDYENYKPKVKGASLEEMEDLFKAGELELLSDILLENVKVETIR